MVAHLEDHTELHAVFRLQVHHGLCGQIVAFAGFGATHGIVILDGFLLVVEQ